MKQNPANRVLFLNTLAFAICFAAWTLYSVLLTYLVDHQVLQLDKSQIGWLMGIPLLTGSIMRLPMGMLADRYGGKPVFMGIMIFSSLALVATSFANGFLAFVIGGLTFGVVGATFSVGVAYTAAWFPKNKQGTALGLLGMGNIGTAITALAAPKLLEMFTQSGAAIEGWRMVPRVYAGALLVMTFLFALFAIPKKVEGAAKSIAQMTSPLKNPRVWRFGFYYFLLFGGFVALSQWLIPYYLNVYGMTLAAAGLMATLFSMPSALTRAAGGFLSDKIGARRTLYFVLSGVSVLFLLLLAPRMDITSPGEGVMSDKSGTVTYVAPNRIEAAGVTYNLKAEQGLKSNIDQSTIVLPKFHSWQTPTVTVGETIKKKQLLATGTTHVYFQANRWVFTGLLFLAAILMGLGMAAVFKHIPEYFPNEVGVVGGLVGVLGGLGGFIMPILFGYLLKATGLWTTCFLLMALLSLISLVVMHWTILGIEHRIERRDEDEAHEGEYPLPGSERSSHAIA
jgi:NNP family nitrate/nitrite transporter-like MFS transporter